MERPEAVRGAHLRNRIPLVDDAVRSRRSQALIKAQQRWHVPRDRIRFAATEFFGRVGQISIYEVLDARARVAVRHRTRDVGIFDEIFVGDMYLPPPAIAAALRDRPPKSVLDLGGNIGLFGAYALALWPSATITSVEPDPANLLVLERCIAANATSRWTAIAACAAAQAGTANFSGGRFADSAIALSGDPVTAQVAMVDAFSLLDDADFAKIDIEGGEWDLLLDPRFAEAHPTVIVLEWHERGCPTDDPFATASEAMHEAGYEVICDAPDPSYTYGMLWAWRPALTGDPYG
jgi:FkbM family methyltransferase